MAAGNASSKIARSWPIFDGMGVHGRVKATGPYYTSIAHALFQFFSTAVDGKTKAPPLLHRSLLRPPEVPAPLAPGHWRYPRGGKQIWVDGGEAPRTKRCYAWRSYAEARPQQGLTSGWIERETELHGDPPRRRPGLVSTELNASVELSLALDAPLGTQFCATVSYMQSYENLGAAVCRCLPPCACDETTLLAHYPEQRVSIVRTAAFAVRAPAPRCWLRFENVGARDQGSGSSMWAEFHMIGIQTALPAAGLEAMAGVCSVA